MTSLSLLAAALDAAARSTKLDPVALFLGADIVVQVVIGGLLIASVWVWAQIIAVGLRLSRARRRCDAFERDFWRSGQDDSEASPDASATATARVAQAGITEWRRSGGTKLRDRSRSQSNEGARQRIAAALDSAVAHEADQLAQPLNFLATVGSVAPFVGLFGTVWGIMNSFFQIGEQQNSSLAVVAPGISEALFATAIGLFAAIPAVIAYNRYSHRVGQFEARLQRFADKVQASLTREMEAE
jgi:biopolymer transport protein TolQ